MDNRSKKHIVFVLGSYHPFFSANGLCVSKVIDVLKKTNKITVICINNQKGLPDIEEYDSQTIIRIETYEHSIRNSINNVIQNSKNKFVNTFSLILLAMVKGTRYLNAILSKDSIIDSLVNKYVKALSRIQDPIDLIVPICFPFESIIAAIKYKKAFNKNVSITPYLFDKFSESDTLHRTLWNKKLKMFKHLRLENLMLEESEHILATTDWEKHLKFHFSQYTDKIEFTDIPALCELPNKAKINYEKNKIHLVYTGSLNSKIRSPKYMLRILSNCMDERQNIVFHMYIKGNCENIVNRFSSYKPEQIINHGTVNAEVAHSAILAANILVSIGNSDITQKPSKIYEYISSGRPIIHFYNSKQDPVIKILKEYPMACCIEQDDRLLNTNKKKIIDFIYKYSNTNEINFDEISNTFIEATPKYAAEKLSKIL